MVLPVNDGVVKKAAVDCVARKEDVYPLRWT